MSSDDPRAGLAAAAAAANAVMSRANPQQPPFYTSRRNSPSSSTSNSLRAPSTESLHRTSGAVYAGQANDSQRLLAPSDRTARTTSGSSANTGATVRRRRSTPIPDRVSANNGSRDSVQSDTTIVMPPNAVQRSQDRQRRQQTREDRAFLGINAAAATRRPPIPGEGLTLAEVNEIRGNTDVGAILSRRAQTSQFESAGPPSRSRSSRNARLPLSWLRNAFISRR